MAYTKAGMKATDKYVKENYDRIGVKIPKGLKTTVEIHAKNKGTTVNGLINTLLRLDMGLSEEEWKRTEDPSGGA